MPGLLVRGLLNVLWHIVGTLVAPLGPLLGRGCLRAPLGRLGRLLGRFGALLGRLGTLLGGLLGRLWTVLEAPGAVLERRKLEPART